MTTQVPNSMLAFDGGALGFRNRLINGAMLIDQRNSGASLTFTAAAAVAYCVDRWYASCTGANITGQQASAVNGGYTLTGAASNTGTLFGQRIESVNVADLVNTTITGQLKVSSSSLTSVTWTAYYASATDNFTTKTQIATGTITVSATPTPQTFSFNAGANAANGIAIEFTSGALAVGQTLTYSQVQLEAGTAATAFERRPVPLELALCQRYFEAFTVVSSVFFAVGQATSATAAIFPLAFKERKRATPTYSSTASYQLVTASGAGAGGVFSTATLGLDSCSISMTSASGLVAGNATLLVTVSAGYLGFSSEL